MGAAVRPPCLVRLRRAGGRLARLLLPARDGALRGVAANTVPDGRQRHALRVQRERAGDTVSRIARTYRIPDFV